MDPHYHHWLVLSPTYTAFIVSVFCFIVYGKTIAFICLGIFMVPWFEITDAHKVLVSKQNCPNWSPTSTKDLKLQRLTPPFRNKPKDPKLQRLTPPFRNKTKNQNFWKRATKASLPTTATKLLEKANKIYPCTSTQKRLYRKFFQI